MFGWFSDYIVGAYGFVVEKALSSSVGGVFFPIVLFFCYTGHFSWGFGLARNFFFIMYWALTGWFMTILVLGSEEAVTSILSLQHEDMSGVFYSLFNKSCSVLVRPLSLFLRLFINVSMGHFVIFVVFMCSGLSMLITNVVVFIYNIYEFVLFILQSFIFSDLIGIYLEEFTTSITSIVVLRSIGRCSIFWLMFFFF